MACLKLRATSIVSNNDMSTTCMILGSQTPAKTNDLYLSSFGVACHLSFTSGAYIPAI